MVVPGLAANTLHSPTMSDTSINVPIITLLMSFVTTSLPKIIPNTILLMKEVDPKCPLIQRASTV